MKMYSYAQNDENITVYTLFFLNFKSDTFFKSSNPKVTQPQLATINSSPDTNGNVGNVRVGGTVFLAFE